MVLVVLNLSGITNAFFVAPSSTTRAASSLAAYQRGRSTPTGNKERSKRQERVGHLVRTELSNILHRGVIKGDATYLDDDLRKRISVVSIDVSPDLRQARVSVSVRTPKKNDMNSDYDSSNSPAVDKRRAYAWLVQNTKPIRHTLAQRMSHMKQCPNLTFVQVDVAAAVDVMYLIDKVASGYKRSNVELFDDDELPSGVVDGIDFDGLDDEEEDWEEEDDQDSDFF